MAIKLTLNNLLIFITSVSPLIITLFLILSSVFHGDLKAIFFLLPLMILQFLIIIGKRAFQKERTVGDYQVKTHMLPTHDICSIFELPFQGHKVNPTKFTMSLNGSFWGYTISYILASIMSVGGGGGGVPFLIFISLLGAADLIFRKVTRCEGSTSMSLVNIGIGLSVGGLIGFMMIAIIYPGMGLDGTNTYFKFEPPQQKCKVINNKFKCVKKRKI